MRSVFFPQRLGRLGWFARFVLVFAAGVALKVARDYPDLHLSIHAYVIVDLVLAVAWLGLAIGLLIYSVLYIHLPRCHSLELPPGMLVLLLLPPINALLLMLFLCGGEGYWPRFRASLAHASSPNSDPSEEEAESPPPS
jgi:hypothetical protein